MDGLPADCIADILSRGSPRDACRSAVVTSLFRTAAESDVLWDRFLPPDQLEIISESVSPVTYKSKKELFFKLSSPLLIDRGLKIWRLEVEGKINTRILSPNAMYRAYLIVQVAHHRAFGLDVVPCEVSVEVGELCLRGAVILSRDVFTKRSLEHVCGGKKVKDGSRSRFKDEVSRVGCERKDGWLEIELGDFYNEGLCEKEV
ncbi:hypothetical protein L1987_49630 [Smallanthus sonchifolius]|uniref:Uncharacterized protein n=1 Tax=Smallanthus sonchifolius TaxID=185202 RepID=A0ACB9FWW3_9ASTR|nr:hypothetical protein L1987_49630 [Smallanthus sonchifolius]